MNRALFILPLLLLLAGCTSVSIQTERGTKARFTSTKNIKLDSLSVDPSSGKLEIKKLESDASSVIRAVGSAATDE